MSIIPQLKEPDYIKTMRKIFVRNQQWALVFGAQTWITVILNGLPWKQTDHSVTFETASKYCILDSFVDYEGYSISSKGFLPTVVGVMVI